MPKQKQINLSPSARPARSRAGVAEWLGAIAAILTFLALLALVVGTALLFILKIWAEVLSMM